MRRNNTLINIDWLTVVLFLILVLGGWINIYSAVYNEEFNNIFDISQRYGKQIIWIGFSLILALFIMVVDSKFFVTFSNLIYIFLIFLLVLVLFVGKEVNGAKSWFVIGDLLLQPAEFAKYGTSLAVARILSSHNFNFKNLKQQLQIIGMILVPVVLIILQNDTGSALVYFVFVIPLFREGMSGLILFFVVYFAILFILSMVISPLLLLLTLLFILILLVLVMKRSWSYILRGLLILLLSSIPFILYAELIKKEAFDIYYILLRSTILSGSIMLLISYFKRIQQLPLILSVFLISLFVSFTVDFAFSRILEPHQQDRINNLLGVESDPLGAGYNVNQSKIAIGSGGLTGKGFLAGTQTKYDFVPEQSTDFIFCTVGEEWGFIGTSFIITIFMILLIRLILLAERQRSVFSRVFGYSVASILFFHFTINIGMTIGLAPVIGIPLPFFSYGGSSLWFFTILLFTFLRLDTSRLEQLK